MLLISIGNMNQWLEEQVPGSDAGVTRRFGEAALASQFQNNNGGFPWMMLNLFVYNKHSVVCGEKECTL